MSSPLILADGTDHELLLHFAVQVCDVRSHQNQPRVCGDDRTLLSKKSLRSLLDSIVYSLEQRPRARFHVMLILDQCSDDLVCYCNDIIHKFEKPGLIIEMRNLLPQTGLADSIHACYQWMQDHGQHVVAQFQDDYLFYQHAIDDVVDMQLQMQREADADAIVCHFHYSIFWREVYFNAPTKRCVMIGRNDYWIQIYDIPCTFMTTHWQFGRHWDLYNFFIEICRVDYATRQDWGLESQSLNHILTRRGVLGVSPMRSLTHHVQGQRELDPHQDWQQLWNSVILD